MTIFGFVLVCHGFCLGLSWFWYVLASDLVIIHWIFVLSLGNVWVYLIMLGKDLVILWNLSMFQC